MHRCASVDWTFRCGLETGRIPSSPPFPPPPPFRRSAFISMNTMCVPTCSDSCQSRCIDLSLSFRFFSLFIGWTVRNFSPPPRSNVPFMCPARFLLSRERGRRFEVVGWEGEGKNKMSIGLSARDGNGRRQWAKIVHREYLVWNGFL